MAGFVARLVQKRRTVRGCLCVPDIIKTILQELTPLFFFCQLDSAVDHFPAQGKIVGSGRWACIGRVDRVGAIVGNLGGPIRVGVR